MKEDDTNDVLLDNNSNKAEQQDLIANMIIVSEIASRVCDKFYKKFDLTQTQFKVLSFLYIVGDEGFNLSVLSKKLGVTKPSVTSLIDRMESMGLVKRILSETDRRSIRAIVTEKGSKIMLSIRSDDEAFKMHLLDFLTEEEKENLNNLIEKIRTGLIAKYLLR